MPEQSDVKSGQMRRDQEARPDNSTPENEYGPGGGSNLETFMESMRDSPPGADSADDVRPEVDQEKQHIDSPASDSADDVPDSGRSHS